MKYASKLIAAAMLIGAPFLAMGTAQAAALNTAAVTGTELAGSTAEMFDGVTDVQYRRRDRLRRDRGFRRRGYNSRVYRGAPRYRGYRGYRQQRRGYRRHRNGFYYAPGAFLGAIIGGAIVNNNARRGYSKRHHNWCDNRYRSYSRYSGTFQPYGGKPRQRCNSPFDGR